MKEREGAHHHTDQPEQAQPEEQGRYRVDHYGKSRNFAVYEESALIAVTLYRKGAAEITARLEEKDRSIAALESQLATKSASQVSPAPSAEEVAAPPYTPSQQLDLITVEDMPAYRITWPQPRPARSKRRP
jgi:hypothetical protein